MPPRLSPSSLLAIQPSRALGLPPCIPRAVPTLPRRLPFPKTPVRLASQRGPRRPQNGRFGNAQNRIQYPHISYGIGAVGLAGGFYYYNLEHVPISGRQRFNCVSSAREQAMAESYYQGIMRAYGRHVLPPFHPHAELVNRVLKRLISAAGLEGQNWEVKVIDDPDQKNAFVLPGGKVFVFSGILPICAGEDGLAAVLGHEIAHNIAHHTAETTSKQFFFLLPFGALLTFFFDLPQQWVQFALDLAFELPGSRKMESEADYIGLLMMAQACYDPNATVKLWERMANTEGDGVPQLLSTHPASRKRITVIQEWLPEANQKRAESPCGITSGYMEDFKTAFAHSDEGFW